MAYNGTYPGYICGSNYGQGQQNYGQGQQNYSQSQNYGQPMGISQPPQLQIQNGGFMVVPSEDIARTYPVAPGNCVTFKIEGKPIVMEKSMGFSQLEAPRIDRYRLVREEDVSNNPETSQESPGASNSNDLINTLKTEVKSLWDEINKLKDQIEDKEGA